MHLPVPPVWGIRCRLRNIDDYIGRWWMDGVGALWISLKCVLETHTGLYYSTLYWTVPYCIVLQCTVLHCTVLFCVVSGTAFYYDVLCHDEALISSTHIALWCALFRVTVSNFCTTRNTALTNTLLLFSIREQRTARGGKEEVRKISENNGMSFLYAYQYLQSYSIETHPSLLN